MNVRLIWITPDAEKHIAYIARVSNPENQDNPDYVKLIRYLIKHKHWSPFEQASACFEITTSRAISAQIIRHRSFTFQEFSQRYQVVQSFETYPARMQATNNRQSSLDDAPIHVRVLFWLMQKMVHGVARLFYRAALRLGIAREQARFLLPISSTTRVYMTGLIRNWIHYLDARCNEHTQQEHRDIAMAIMPILTEQLPIIAQALEWQ